MLRVIAARTTAPIRRVVGESSKEVFTRYFRRVFSIAQENNALVSAPRNEGTAAKGCITGAGIYTGQVYSPCIARYSYQNDERSAVWYHHEKFLHHV